LKKIGEKNMEVSIVMPQLGNEIEEAQVDAWLKSTGDKVTLGEQILTITTPKLTMEIEAPASGILKEIIVAADELATVGAILGVIESD
jgi:pyruvate/2-oxoglutarate dehydrogenase complex dihydrolipoamide acyltransferase (E2) component